MKYVWWTMGLFFSAAMWFVCLIQKDFIGILFWAFCYLYFHYKAIYGE
jgi:hypothetical protein